jgi:stage II sporulation protein AA (anti-sigma F factor antagonist)
MRMSLVSSEGDIVRLRCEGNISQRDIDPGSDPIEGLLGAGCYKHKVLLSLEHTHYVDSSGVGWLMGRHKQFLSEGGRLVLHSIPPMVSQVLHLLRMSLILHMAADESAALVLAAGDKQ